MAHYTNVNPLSPKPGTARNYKSVHVTKVALGVMKKEIKTLDFWRAVISECLGTFFYVLLGCSTILELDPTIRFQEKSVLVSICFGLTLAALVQCFGHISGGHFNPAVTIALLVTCKITPLRAVMYVSVQIGGAIAGAAVLYGIVPSEDRGNLGMTELHPQLAVSQAFGVEVLLTFLLVFVIFATIDPKKKELGSKSLAIGLALTACHLAGYNLTMCSLNPARSLGPAFVNNRWQHQWIYLVAPLTGGIVSGLLYEYIFDPKRPFKTTFFTKTRTDDMRQDVQNEVYQMGECKNTHELQSQENNTYGFTAFERPRATRNYMAMDPRVGQENQAYSNESNNKRHPLLPNTHLGQNVHGEQMFRDKLIFNEVRGDTPYNFDSTHPYQYR